MGRIKKANRIVVDNGTWLEVDVSTTKLPGARMLVDKDSWDKLQNIGIGRVHAFKNKTNMYARCRLGSRHVKIHRLLIENASSVDHINGDGLDNRMSNIRSVTNRQNHQNRTHERTSLHPGVCFNRWRDKWVATIKVGDKTNNLGAFEDEEDAAEAYRNAVERLGEKMINT